jgi:flagellar hook-basal body complex protein FliE
VTAPIGGVSIPSVALTGVGGAAELTSAAGIGGAAGTVGPAGSTGAQSSSGSDFASALATSLDQLQSTQSAADTLATQAATGNLRDISDYMIASNEASLATDTVVTLKNQAVSAFNEIMRMPV